MVDKWLIWSHEHTAFWRPNHMGYTCEVSEAGRYSFKEAFKIVKGANYPSDDNGYPIDPFKGNQYRNNYLNEIMCPSPEMIEELMELYEI